MNETTLLKQLRQSQDWILETSIDLINEKAAWKNRALMLASKSRLCFRCGNNKDWNLATLQCGLCRKNVEAMRKEVSHD